MLLIIQVFKTLSDRRQSLKILLLKRKLFDDDARNVVQISLAKVMLTNKERRKLFPSFGVY